MDRKKQDAPGTDSFEDWRMATALHSARATSPGIARRVASLDWSSLGARLDENGHAVIEQLLDASDCASIAGLYDTSGPFRSRVVMARHGFGRGEYQYFTYPLPAIVEELRDSL